MTKPELLTLNADYDRKLIWQHGGSVRYLLLEVQAAESMPVDSGRGALNLALVVDVSGSMQGAPLEAAKQAARGIVDALKPGDCLSIVTFNTSACVLLEARRMDDAGRDEAHQAIEQMQGSGCTNLAAGWLGGAECVARMAQVERGIHHVLVLSDGHANKGECNPARLAEIAEGLCERGVPTSCIGIGDYYSPIQLQAISDAGGRLHDAQHPQEIIEVVTAELEAICSTVVENITLHIDGPDTLGVEPLGFYPCRSRGRGIEVSIGALLPGASRRVALKFVCLRKRSEVDADRFEVAVRATYRDLRNDQAVRTKRTRRSLTYAPGRINNHQHRNPRVSLEVARLWQAHLVRQAIEMNLEQAYGRAHQYVRHQLGYFERYCEDLEGTEVLVDEVLMVLRAIGRPWTGRSSKEVMLSSNKMLRAEQDFRQVKRAHWSKFVGR